MSALQPPLLRALTLLVALGLASVLPLAAAADDEGPGPAEAGPSRLVTALGAAVVGQPLPSFAGPALDGTFGLTRYLKGQPDGPVAVTLFATWCPNCKRQLPGALEVVQSLAPLRAGLVVIDVQEPDEGQARDWLRRRKVGEGPRQAVVLDPFRQISEGRLGVKVLPKTFVLDSSGVVRAIFDHEGDDFPEALRRELERAAGRLAGGAIPAGGGAR